MTAQRMRKWAAASFLAALLVLAVMLMNAGGGPENMFLIFGQLLTIFLAGLAVVLMIISLFFPHEIE